MKVNWSDYQIFQLAMLYPYYPIAEVAEAIGKPVSRIRNRAIQLKIRKIVKHFGKPVTFTAEQDAFIKANYLIMPEKTIAKKISKSGFGVRLALKRLGLKIPREIIEKRIKESQYKKGRTPENKGKKMPPDKYAKCAVTMFKKGNIPHNTNYDGHERISKDGVIEVRVKLGLYVAKHRLIWEKANGIIPKGHIVVFKDKNPLNCVLENLEMITREENMRRNTVHRYPPELKHVMKLTKKLERRIKNHEEQNNRLAQSPV